MTLFLVNLHKLFFPFFAHIIPIQLNTYILHRSVFVPDFLCIFT